MTPKVLVVEDEPDVNELLCQILEIHGFESTGVLEGEQGVQVAADWRPGSVILDLMLPDLDGFEVCRRVKERTDNQIGVLILTALQSGDIRERAFEAGADRFLSKPFLPQEVVEQVRSMTQEYQDSNQPGLRKAMSVKGTAIAEWNAVLEGFLQDLFHMTPLPAEVIVETGNALRGVASHVREDREAQHLNLACQVFRDRLEHTFRMDVQRSERIRSGRDLFCRLFNVGTVEPLPTLVSQLGNSIWFAEDRPEMVLTRTFA